MLAHLLRPYFWRSSKISICFIRPTKLSQEPRLYKQIFVRGDRDCESPPDHLRTHGSGIYIYSGGALPAMGDSVIVSGEISEFCWDGSSPCNCSACGGAGVTEFYQPEDIYVISNNNPLPEPILVSSGEALSEEYEGVLIRMEGVECLTLPSGFGVWEVDDGTGSCGIHYTPDGYEFDPQIGETYNITGIDGSPFDSNEYNLDIVFLLELTMRVFAN